MDLRLQPKQSFALQSRATEILYGGSAGGGKSYLMRVTAIMYCMQIPNLNVYLFRRLSDDLVKNHVEGGGGFRAMLTELSQQGFVKYNETMKTFTFWNGSKIFLCHCQHEKDMYKYQGAEIHLLCVSPETKVFMGDSSLKMIKDLKVNEEILTLGGVKKIKKVIKGKNKKAERIITPFGSQINPLAHSVLRDSSSWESQLEHSFVANRFHSLCRFLLQQMQKLQTLLQNHEQSIQQSKLFHALEKSTESLSCHKDFFSLLTTAENCFAVCYDSRLKEYSPQESFFQLRLALPHLRTKIKAWEKDEDSAFLAYVELLQGASSRPIQKSQILEKFQRILARSEDRKTCQCEETSELRSSAIHDISSLLPTASATLNMLLHQLSHIHEYLERPLSHEAKNGHYYSEEQEYLMDDYSADCGLCDEQLQQVTTAVVTYLQRLIDVAGNIHQHENEDFSVDILEYIRPCQDTHLNPYTGEIHSSSLDSVMVPCFATPCNDLDLVYDLNVEEENHYITEAGIINKNCIDELTHFSESIYRFLRGRCRLGSGLKIPTELKGRFPLILCGANPGGIGHNWVKKTFIDYQPPLEINKTEPSEGGMLRQFIPARLSDNKKLLESDPNYANNLSGLGNPNLVKAMLEGSWDIAEGGMFDDVFDADIHMVDQFKIPKSWRIDRTHDWGSSKPFATVWFAESDGCDIEINGEKISTIKGDLYIIAEDYGWNGEANKGLKLTNQQVALRIKNIDKEVEEWTGIKVKAGPADSAIFNDKGGKTTNTADDYKREGVIFTSDADKSAGSRVTGWQKLRDLLKSATEENRENQALFIFKNCVQFRRTVPTLPRDARKTDDVDSASEDHYGDAIRYRILQKKKEIKTMFI